MNQPAAAVDLSTLDAYRPGTVAPAIWSANRAALSGVQPDLVELLRGVALPSTWRPALALDDALTYRCEELGAPPAWLGNTAAPLTRARAQLGQFDPAGKNPALPCIGTGAELRALLDRLPVYLAAFVFEADPCALAAVLRTQDFSTPIARGQCLLIPPGRELAYLTELMSTHPGLLPPGNLVLPDLVPPARLEELRVICEQIFAATARRRGERLHALASAAPPAAMATAGTTPRFAVLALHPQRTVQALAVDLEQAARSLEWPVLRRIVADPHSVHPLVHCAALAEFAPSLTLCVNHLHTLLSAAPAGTTCVWILDETSAPAEVPHDGTLWLAASPRVVAALRRAGVREDVLIPWYWACSAEEGAPLGAEGPGFRVQGPGDGPGALTLNNGTERGRCILLVGDLPDLRPGAHRITQPTHRRLWEQLRVTVAQVWETPRVLQPAQLLVRAERECGVALVDRALRERTEQLIERAIIPAVVLEQIACGLSNEPAEVLALGQGWERLSARNLRPLATDLFALPDRGAGLRPRGCIFAGAGDPLTAALLHAAANGWPVLMHALGGQSPAPALGDVLQPGRHFESFVDLTGLRHLLQSLRAAPEAGLRRAQRARDHVREHHSYRRRLRDLVAFVHSVLSRKEPH